MAEVKKETQNKTKRAASTGAGTQKKAVSVKAAAKKVVKKEEVVLTGKKGEKEVIVKLKCSGIGRPKDQKATIKGLGFKRLNHTLKLKDTPENRGMIRKISHLLEVL